MDVKGITRPEPGLPLKSSVSLWGKCKIPLLVADKAESTELCAEEQGDGKSSDERQASSFPKGPSEAQRSSSHNGCNSLHFLHVQ